MLGLIAWPEIIIFELSNSFSCSSQGEPCKTQISHVALLHKCLKSFSSPDHGCKILQHLVSTCPSFNHMCLSFSTWTFIQVPNTPNYFPIRNFVHCAKKIKMESVLSRELFKNGAGRPLKKQHIHFLT